VAQAEHFEIVDRPLPSPEQGEVLVRNSFLSVEPAMRGWIADIGNYSAAVEIGAVMRSLAVGHVVESHSPDYLVGDALLGWFGWQQYSIGNSGNIIGRIEHSDLPLSLSLGVLGLTGVTALLALTKIGDPKPGDMLVVSTAAGSVGSAVGQIGRMLGCRTVGITGSDEKVALCREAFGYDAAINYRSGDLDAALAATCPDGVDIYFDNTAGSISDSVLRHLATFARIVNCGTASISDWTNWPTGPRVERHLLVKRARMQGFVIFDHMHEWPAAVRQLAQWVRSGQLRYEEDVLEGIEAAPDALAGLYRGENKGKRVIRL
jgi:NADPH-dependent curcumin reductase CurA